MAKRAGAFLAAAAIAVVLANSDDRGTGTSTAAGPVVDTYAGQFAASRQLMARGQAAAAWSRLGLAPDPGNARRRDTDCVANSFGDVRGYLRRVPCLWLDRLLFTVHDKGGNKVVIAVAWVAFATPGQAQELKRIDDIWGTGQIRPLPGATLGLPDTRLSGQHYASALKGTVAVIAEAEPVSGTLGDTFLDNLAAVAVDLPHS